ncbi:MAG: hypothetical protein GEV08_12695 [Acidimicrobiia bacterium]|nr:hypothetical protein [Acidimicrobiia bacterium]
MQGAQLLDSLIEVAARPGGPSVFHPRPEDPRVTLELTATAAWVVDQYAVEHVEALDGGGVRVRLAVSALPWLERLLLRLGPDGEIVAADPPLDAHVGARAARRVLARYR